MRCDIHAVVESSIPSKGVECTDWNFRIIRGPAPSVGLSELTDYLLMGCRNDAGIIRKISAVLSGKYFLRIIEISHLNI